MKLPNAYDTIIVVLAVLALINGYVQGMLPLALASVALAVGTASVVEIAAEYYKTRKVVFSKSREVPSRSLYEIAISSRSPVVSGLIIGSIVQPGAWTILATAAVLAIVLKKLVVRNSMPVFNPAALGLWLTFLVFNGLGEAWWNNGPGNLIALEPATVAVIAGGLLVSWRIKKLRISLAYLAVFAVGTALTSHPSTNALAFLPFFSGFFMLTEPKTTPNDKNHQIVFGALAAVLMHALGLLTLPSSFLLGILVSNLVGKLILK